MNGQYEKGHHTQTWRTARNFNFFSHCSSTPINCTLFFFDWGRQIQPGSIPGDTIMSPAWTLSLLLDENIGQIDISYLDSPNAGWGPFGVDNISYLDSFITSWGTDCRNNIFPLDSFTADWGAFCANISYLDTFTAGWGADCEDNISLLESPHSL